MDRNRFVVGDAAWGKVAPLLPGKASDSGVTAKDNRLFLEAVLWRGPPRLPPRGPPGGLGIVGEVVHGPPRPGEGEETARIPAHPQLLFRPFPCKQKNQEMTDRF